MLKRIAARIQRATTTTEASWAAPAVELTPAQIRQEANDLLMFARWLTVDRSIPEDVRDNALVLRDWLDAASDIEDRRARLAALRNADNSRDTSRRPDDDPALLIAEAEPYYEFLGGA